MKILVLNYEFPPLGGGAGNATYYLLKEFSKKKEIEIVLVTSSVGKYKEEKFADNVKIYFLDIGKKGNLHYQSMKDLLIYSWKSFWFCRKLIQREKFDLIHAFFGIPCGYIAMKLGLPYIVSLRGSDVPFYNQRFYWLDRLVFSRLSKKIWKNAKKVIANSGKLKELADTSAPKQQIEIITNGIDIEEFTPLVNKEITIPIKLISTGRLIERKGYKYLIEAIAGMKDAELTLIGDGNIKAELEVQAKEQNSNVIFLGKKNHSEVVNLLQKADIFVLPSLNEGMSNSILEAMATGLPIITSDTGGSNELVINNGFIVEKANSDKLKEAIVHYLVNPEIIKLYGEKSRQLAEKMSWKEVAKNYIYNYL